MHGGPDRSVYAYAAEDYTWWERELGRERLQELLAAPELGAAWTGWIQEQLTASR